MSEQENPYETIKNSTIIITIIITVIITIIITIIIIKEKYEM